jgi:hypothetical protein
MASMIKSSDAVQCAAFFSQCDLKGPYTGGERLSSISGNHGIPETLQAPCPNREIGLNLKTLPGPDTRPFPDL